MCETVFVDEVNKHPPFTEDEDGQTLRDCKRPCDNELADRTLRTPVRFVLVCICLMLQTYFAGVDLLTVPR